MRVSHNARYNALQNEYFKKRDSRILTRMYEIAKEVSYHYLRKYCQRKGIRLRNLTELSHDSAMFVIDQYLRKPDFRILRISAYIHFGVIKTLFRDKAVETQEVSYEGIIETGWDKRLSLLNRIVE
jgi:hypothetical protein